MRIYTVCAWGAALIILAAGCETPEGRPDRTATGALTGAALGAGTGAIIGGASGHHAGEGALIGGAIGALTGGIIGNAMDQQQREMLARQSPQTLERFDQGQPLSLADIKALAKAGISDKVIISQIRNSHMAYTLSTAEIIDLKDSGVSEKVIDFMINTASMYPLQAAPFVAPGPPPPAPAETIVVAPGPDYVWMAGYWGWRGRWVWMPGLWVLPPHPHGVWVRGYWARRPRGWAWREGYWR